MDPTVITAFIGAWVSVIGVITGAWVDTRRKTVPQDDKLVRIEALLEPLSTKVTNVESLMVRHLEDHVRQAVPEPAPRVP